jgi:predicted dehydrogenase
MHIPLVDLQAQYSTIKHEVMSAFLFDWIEPLHLECEDFANSIRTGAQPRANGQVGLAVVRVLAAVQEALERQEKQTLMVKV